MSKGISIHADVKTDEVKKMLADAEKKAVDLRDPLAKCGVIAMRSFDKNFQNQGRPTRWQQLAASTLRRRKKKGRGAKILQDTGRLKQSVTVRNFPGAIYRLETDSLTLGTNLEIATIHQFGGTIKIPERKQSVAFKRFRSGKRKGQVRFSTLSKSTFGRTFRMKAHTITIPARPYLIVQDPDRKDFERTFKKYFDEIKAS